MNPSLAIKAELLHLQIRADRYRHGLNPKRPRNGISSISLDAPDPTVAAYHSLAHSRQSLPTYLLPGLDRGELSWDLDLSQELLALWPFGISNAIASSGT